MSTSASTTVTAPAVAPGGGSGAAPFAPLSLPTASAPTPYNLGGGGIGLATLPTLGDFSAPPAPGTPGSAPAVAPAGSTSGPIIDSEGKLMFGDRSATVEEINKFYGVDKTDNTLLQQTLALSHSLKTQGKMGYDVDPQQVKDYTEAALAVGEVETIGLDNKGRDIRNRKGEEEITSMQFDRWGKVGGMALALFDKVLQAAWMSHRAGIEDSMMTLAENKEDNRYNLQWELVQKQSELQNTAMKYDYQKTRIAASTEKYKAKLAADVKKAKIKQDSLKDLFFPRNSYSNGNFAYA